MTGRIEQLLALANGKRRVRILTLRHVHLVLSGLPKRRGSFNADSGGPAPGAYDRRSVTTVCLAVRRSDERIALAIGTTEAKEGHILRPFWLAPEIPSVGARYRNQMLFWADRAVERVEPDGGVLILWFIFSYPLVGGLRNNPEEEKA